MPWWASVYILFIGVICAAGAISDWRRRQRPGWHVAFDVVAGLALIFLIAGRWHSHLVTPLGRTAAFLFSLMLVWDVYSTSCDLAELQQDPELTPRENAWVERGVLLTGAVVVAPAYALALMSVVFAWH